MNIYEWERFREHIKKWSEQDILDRLKALDEEKLNGNDTADIRQEIHFLNLELERKYEEYAEYLELLGGYVQAVRP